MVKSLQLGTTLRKFRLEKNLTLQQLADMVGATASYLSQLENEKVSPSIQSLKKIADVLEVSLIEFFENDLINDPVINPPNEWTQLSLNGWDAEVKQMIRLVGNKKMQPFFTTIPPGGGAFDHYAHPGEEFVYVLEGTLTLDLDGETKEVPAGSSAYFSSMMPHTWKNLSDNDCRMIWVCCPPSW